ncbi:hypothetical protein BXZ70DRAFT_904537 [Cristinia sonorae]|uniref:ABM domain-containing protein n=1 Tax=Cristinia sonorae TaxID=1940300 RepID=A0A8K0UWP6_9AGAR|nr:hypothetical protein BXZ70DRAFT_904537 [Cristinia sonorae]
MTTPAKVGLFVPLVAKPPQTTTVKDFLISALPLVEAEPETLQWFAIQYTSRLSVSPTSTSESNSEPLTTHYLIFDTFAADSGRQAHLNGKVAAALMGNREALLVEGDEGVAIKPVEVLQHKVGKLGEGKKLVCGLRVLMTANKDKVEDVKQHLINVGTKLLDEANPPVWYGFWFPDTAQFGIIGLFTSEAEREERLAGQTAVAMRFNELGIFESPPEVIKVNVLASSTK